MKLYQIKFSNGHRTLVESANGITTKMIDDAWFYYDLLIESRDGVTIEQIKFYV